MAFKNHIHFTTGIDYSGFNVTVGFLNREFEPIITIGICACAQPHLACGCIMAVAPPESLKTAACYKTLIIVVCVLPTAIYYYMASIYYIIHVSNIVFI